MDFNSFYGFLRTTLNIQCFFILFFFFFYYNKLIEWPTKSLSYSFPSIQMNFYCEFRWFYEQVVFPSLYPRCKSIRCYNSLVFKNLEHYYRKLSSFKSVKRKQKLKEKQTIRRAISLQSFCSLLWNAICGDNYLIKEC